MTEQAPAPSRETAVLKLTALLPSTVLCEGCVGRLCARVAELPGVDSASCDKRIAAMTVVFDPSTISRRDLEDQASRIGRSVGGSIAHASYRLTGLD
jgi:hypothetical protein